ncbi:hypothetical protein MKW98_011229 [Papaver atlanticum]|uniref:Uncharacterized protein n=1 Tax=Papaver atlanticum TaxID=357466 RepID=A0AAD4SVI1_9MAGN|nr:hypothetical protein MKW98_011229 [Papaver atlanticum]
MQKKFQSLHSAIKETQIPSKSFSNPSKRDAGGVPRDESRKPSFLDDQNRNTRDEHDEVTAKKEKQLADLFARTYSSGKWLVLRERLLSRTFCSTTVISSIKGLA